MTTSRLPRRAFLGSATAMAAAAAVAPIGRLSAIGGEARADRVPVKLSCNLYSFNEPLTNGSMSLDEVLRLCSDLGFAAVDPTAYYLRGYPAVPDDAYLHGVARSAFLLGLDISGTGVRNDFTLADAERRRAEVALVKGWIVAAAKLGAPVLRVFAGQGVPDGAARAAARERVVEAMRECAAFGGEHGVMVVIQNHWDFVRTAEQTLDLLDAVDSEWFGLMVDIGSYRTGDPYEEIARVAARAVTWQIKENVFRAGVEEPTDLARIMAIVRESGYRGYLPIETLGPGDPREKVPRFLEAVRAAGVG